jgi:Fibrobacter succinogenes major domain (Fib_succ_major).
VPTDSDFIELGRYFGHEYNVETNNHMSYVAEYLLSPHKWYAVNENRFVAQRKYTNESGFTMLPSGGATRDKTGSWYFSVEMWGARYWTSSRNSDYMSCWGGSGIDEYVLLWVCELYGMYSLRCVK